MRQSALQLINMIPHRFEAGFQVDRVPTSRSSVDRTLKGGTVLDDRSVVSFSRKTRERHRMECSKEKRGFSQARGPSNRKVLMKGEVRR